MVSVSSFCRTLLWYYAVGITFASRDSTTLMTLFKALILSRLDYFSQLWSPHLISHIIQIEKHSFTKFITGMCDCSYSDRLSLLRLYSLQRRRERYCIIYVWKIIEDLVPNFSKSVVCTHLINNDIVDNFQSAYKTGHSCETALLRVYNDIVTTIGRGNGAMLVLLDLSAAFDTIDHDNLFFILEKYVGICGNALKLIKSSFSNRTQRIQIDNVLSDFANIICGVPQGSVLGPLKFCLYLLPLSAILRYHNIGYHVYADDTQLYVSFKCKQPLEAFFEIKQLSC